MLSEGGFPHFQKDHIYMIFLGRQDLSVEVGRLERLSEGPSWRELREVMTVLDLVRG